MNIINMILGLILLVSGIAEIVDQEKAVNFMLEFKIIPEALILIIISVLPVLEILIGVFLVSGMYHKFATISAFVLFSGFLIISIYGTITGLHSDCGCFGSVVKNRIGWGMIVRNGVFVLVCGYAGRRWEKNMKKSNEKYLNDKTV